MAENLLWQKDAPIIRRVDENDVYKILMMYLIWDQYPDLQVRFAFKNRTADVLLGEEYLDLDEVTEQIGATSELRYTDEVIDIYRSWDMFPEEFLSFLKSWEADQPLVGFSNGSFSAETDGRWLMDTPWETQVLPIVSELYGRGRAAAEGISEAALFNAANARLTEKIKLFKEWPELRIAQFGLRRRFSGLWEQHVTERLLNETSVITGVSNMYLADHFGVDAQGTNAHELPMALTALASHSGPKAMRQAPYLVLELWQRLYGHKSLIMLDDAYGSDAFRRDLMRKFLEDYKGFRHDSGDPLAYGETVIALYEQYGIDPKSKLIIFSDGLKPQTVIELFTHFRGRINVAFGMGTNLTNDMGLIKPLSLVMKIVEAAGKPAVKLSNNLNKATGPEEAIQHYKRVFGYTNTHRESVVY